MELTPQFEELLVMALKEKLPEVSKLVTKQVVSKVGKERFRDGAELVFSFLEDSCGSNLSQNETSALLSRMLRCLNNYISTMCIPVTIKTVFDNMHLLPYAVNLAFPGYAEAGLLRAVITPKSLPRAS
jgi:hypothetical protein